MSDFPPVTPLSVDALARDFLRLIGMAGGGRSRPRDGQLCGVFDLTPDLTKYLPNLGTGCNQHDHAHLATANVEQPQKTFGMQSIKTKVRGPLSV